MQTPSDGPARGAVRYIKRFAEGLRAGHEYADVHREYEDVAEAAIRRENIPLTRRDYVRRYFEAVRPD
ncbi:MAG: hypothetical protein IPK74_21285 [Deltaproteobacteria bacterium]|nr:hypothetical protein [Deltaproteobacteria bacterium]